MYFPKHRLTTDFDEKKPPRKYDKDERKNAIKEYLNCKFIRINPDEKYFYMYVVIHKIYNHVNKPSKKILINKISKNY